MMKQALVLSIAMLASPLWAGTYSGGGGTEANPYQIATSADWLELTATIADWNRHFVLTQDIDFGGSALTPVGTWANPFTGVFNGRGHVLKNAVVNLPGVDMVGIFGFVGSGGRILELGVQDVTVHGHRFVGGLVGQNNGGTITSCYVTGSVSGTDYIGGLVGWNSGTVTSSYATGSVSGGWYVGGLVGWNEGTGTVTSSWATGSVTGGGQFVGGLVGGSMGTITSCYATGSVTGGWYVGGLVGGSTGTITSSYATGLVTGGNHVGGLVGGNWGTITSSFWDIEASGQTTSAGGIGKTTAEMQTRSTFTGAGWDFDETWSICEGMTYPRLQWQIEYSGGCGTEANPFQLSTAADWLALTATAADWDKHFVLTQDIDFGGAALTPVGTAATPFTGVFNGRGHVLKNAVVNLPASENVGIFGVVCAGSRILELGVQDVTVHGWFSVGGLVGLNWGTITSSYATGSVSGEWSVGGLVGNNTGTLTSSYATGSVSGEWSVGGLVGGNHKGNIASSYAAGSVSGTSAVGGLVGGTWGGIITSSYAAGSVSGVGESDSVGGLVGGNWYGAITSSYATGPVSGTLFVGGLVGGNLGAIASSYATGSVSGTWSVGGLVGAGWVDEAGGSGTTTFSFWDMETSGLLVSDGGTGKTTEEMQMLSTYAAAWWDFDTVWSICEGAYPLLQWQILPGDLVCPAGVDFNDFAVLASWWMSSDCGLYPDCNRADLNQDGSVNLLDLLIFAEHWLQK